MGLVYSDGSPLKWPKIQRERESSSLFDELICREPLVVGSSPLVTTGRKTGTSVLQPQGTDFWPKPCELDKVPKSQIEAQPWPTA